MSASRSSHALFPGTFDPPTLGHLALVRRALHLFDRVTVALAAHPTKRTLFTIEEREQLLRESLQGEERVSFARFEGLVVDGAREHGCDVIVRGVRSGTDFDYEVTLARNNRAMYPELDTVLLVPEPQVAHVTSTIVREISGLGGDPQPFVPAPVARALAAKFSRGR